MTVVRLSLLAVVTLLAGLLHGQERDNEYWTKVFQRTDIDSLRTANEKEEYCVNVDASASVDPDNPGLEFHWEMPGNRVQKGVKSRLCFDRPGLYEVHLNIFDPFSKLTNVHDTTMEVYISDNVSFKMRGSRRLAGLRYFEVPREYRERKPDSKFVFLYDDGKVTERYRDQQTFSKSGTYRLRLLEFEEDGDDIKLISGYERSIPITIRVSE